MEWMSKKTRVVNSVNGGHKCVCLSHTCDDTQRKHRSVRQHLQPSWRRPWHQKLTVTRQMPLKTSPPSPVS